MKLVMNRRDVEVDDRHTRLGSELEHSHPAPARS
jgi:hypothetical protein